MASLFRDRGVLVVETMPMRGTEDEFQHKKPTKLIRGLLLCAGLLALGTGLLGIFLPLLPTTPLVLLSATCFLRSSDKLYHWITKNKTFGSYIHNYLHSRTVPAKSKPISITLVWVCILLSVYFTEKTWIRILLIIVACGVSIHLMLLRTNETSLEGKNISQNDEEKAST